jgi:HpcH/HpaI aldolase/citrate lyase family
MDIRPLTSPRQAAKVCPIEEYTCIDEKAPIMIIRSRLFVPEDNERKLEKAGNASAEVLILDLEDAVASERRQSARGSVPQDSTKGPCVAIETAASLVTFHAYLEGVSERLTVMTWGTAGRRAAAKKDWQPCTQEG